jgi:phospholipid/cholesterol/gamma-HCH transport system ATP-binding protein
VSAPLRALDAPAPGTPVLRAAGLRKTCGDRHGLDGFDLELAAGERLVLFGAAGAGKTLALHVLLGIERAEAGSVALFGVDPGAVRGRERRALCARVGYAPARDALFEDRSVEENLALALPERPGAVRRRAIREALLLVGLKHVEHLQPSALGPGVRRRVALARAIAHAPALLVADEPVAGLDPVAAATQLALLAQLATRLELTLLVATRDPRALAGASRVAFVHGGRVAQVAAPAALGAVADPALQQLLAARPYGPLA